MSLSTLTWASFAAGALASGTHVLTRSTRASRNLLAGTPGLTTTTQTERWSGSTLAAFGYVNPSDPGSYACIPGGHSISQPVTVDVSSNGALSFQAAPAASVQVSGTTYTRAAAPATTQQATGFDGSQAGIITYQEAGGSFCMYGIPSVDGNSLTIVTVGGSDWEASAFQCDPDSYTQVLAAANPSWQTTPYCGPSTLPARSSLVTVVHKQGSGAPASPSSSATPSAQEAPASLDSPSPSASVAPSASAPAAAPTVAAPSPTASVATSPAASGSTAASPSSSPSEGSSPSATATSSSSALRGSPDASPNADASPIASSNPEGAQAPSSTPLTSSAEITSVALSILAILIIAAVSAIGYPE